MKKELLLIMFLLGVSLSLLNFLPHFKQNGTVEAQFNEQKILIQV